jgi:hypothetical protein
VAACTSFTVNWRKEKGLPGCHQTTPLAGYQASTTWDEEMEINPEIHSRGKPRKQETKGNPPTKRPRKGLPARSSSESSAAVAALGAAPTWKPSARWPAVGDQQPFEVLLLPSD